MREVPTEAVDGGAAPSSKEGVVRHRRLFGRRWKGHFRRRRIDRSELMPANFLRIYDILCA